MHSFYFVLTVFTTVGFGVPGPVILMDVGLDGLEGLVRWMKGSKRLWLLFFLNCLNNWFFLTPVNNVDF